MIQLQIMRFNFLSLHDKIRTKNDALKFAQDRCLIKTTAKCKTCAQNFTVQHTQAQTNYVFFTCTQCHTKESIRKDTFLYNKVNLNQGLKYNLIFLCAKIYKLKFSLISCLEHLHQVLPFVGTHLHPDAEHDYPTDHLPGFLYP